MDFVQRIRERFPEGLTGIIAVGGTRTTYILEHNRDSDNPGQITDFAAYGADMMQRYFHLADSFFQLGGQNLIVPTLAYQRFTAYDASYTRRMSAMTMQLTTGFALDYYHTHEVDPYFVGIDTLLKQTPDSPGHQLSLGLMDFQRAWNYQAGRRKILWEIAPIPLYSFWNVRNTVDPQTLAAIDAEIERSTDLENVYQMLYRLYARAVYGVEIPLPHFYLGTNRNGDLKLRAMAPIALLNGSNTRFYFTPYPSPFTTLETVRAIIEDVAFGSTMSSMQADYDQRLSSETVRAEYERVMALSADPATTLGFIRHIDVDE